MIFGNDQYNKRSENTFAPKIIYEVPQCVYLLGLFAFVIAVQSKYAKDYL